MQRHPADMLSLLSGAVFIVAGALMLANRLDVLTQAHWLLPLLLIVVALAMFASASWSARRDRDGDSAGR